MTEPTGNRWLPLIGGVMMNIVLGTSYAWSVFILPLDGDPVLISWSGPGLFSRLYDRPYPSWVEDRRILGDRGAWVCCE